MQLRSTALFSAVLCFAFCGAGHAQSYDHSHPNDDHDKFNTHAADCDGGHQDGDNDGGHQGGDNDGGDQDGGGSGSSNPSSGSSLLNTGGLYLVQGAPGRDLSSAYYPTYPIDVLVNNTSCLVENAPFPSVQGAFVEPAGTYDLKISPANPAAPCTNPYVLETQAVVNSAQATYVVVALSLQSKLTAYTFHLTLPAVQPGSAGVVIADAADAPALDPAAGVSPLGGLSAPSTPMTNSPTALTPGQSVALVLPAGSFQGNIYYAGTNQPAVGPITDTLQSRSTVAYFIVGSSLSGSLQIISSKVPDVY